VKPPTVTVHSLGNEREPVAVVENFASDPDVLRVEAGRKVFKCSEDYYPGLKAPVSETYLAAQHALLATVLREVFGIAGNVSVLDVRYAMVTTPAAELTLQQRIPHVDGLEPDRIALIHYLVPEGCDGTAFYRHRSTKFETIDQARSQRYFASLNEDLRMHGHPPPAYLAGETSIFEQIGRFAGDYNRALIYRGRLLHCGAIGEGSALPEDPEIGRLTITGFFAAN
jgi:hypothetical protein